MDQQCAMAVTPTKGLMMRIKLTCENCTARLRASSGHTGRRGPRSECGMTMRVPSMPRRSTPCQRIEQRAANSEQRAKMAPSQPRILDPRSSILVLALAACLVLLTLGLVWITVSMAELPRIAREQNATIGATQAFAVSPAGANTPAAGFRKPGRAAGTTCRANPSLSWAVPICRGKRPAWLDNGNSWSTIGNCSARKGPRTSQEGGRTGTETGTPRESSGAGGTCSGRRSKRAGKGRRAAHRPGARRHPIQGRASRYPWPGEPVGSRSAQEHPARPQRHPPFPEILIGQAPE